MIGSLKVLPFPLQAVAPKADPIVKSEPELKPELKPESVALEPEPMPEPAQQHVPVEPDTYPAYRTPLLNTEDLLNQQDLHFITIGTAVMAAVLVSILVSSMLK
jgi:hypothetical protein